MTDAAFGRALGAARRVLAAAPAGLLTDLDGTLAGIVRDPSAVRLADGASDALSALTRRLAVVAVVTGRAASDARRIVGSPSVLVAGNHGIEWLLPDAMAPTIAPQLAEVSAALDQLLASVPHERGVEVDNKRYSATVHYRATADPAHARERIIGALRSALARGASTPIELREGRMSVELRPAGGGDKGSAVRELVERFGLRGMLVFGDDVTDLDMFRAAAELRAAGQVDAAIIAVGGGELSDASAEVPPSVLAAADAVLAGPDEVVRLLAAVVSSGGRASRDGSRRCRPDRRAGD